MTLHQVTGIVLAGGAASRMGGCDKGLQRLDGRPLVEYMLATLAPLCEQRVISANRNLAIYRHYGHRVITDDSDDFGGPLAGLAKVLPAIDTRMALVVPCDMPMLPVAVLQGLLSCVAAGSSMCVAAHAGHVHHAVFACEVAPALQSLLRCRAEGVASLHAWQRATGTCQVLFDQPHWFANCNTLAALDDLGANIRRGEASTGSRSLSG